MNTAVDHSDIDAVRYLPHYGHTGQWIAVQPCIRDEMDERAARQDDQRQVALDRNDGDLAQRPIAAPDMSVADEAASPPTSAPGPTSRITQPHRTAAV